MWRVSGDPQMLSRHGEKIRQLKSGRKRNTNWQIAKHVADKLQHGRVLFVFIATRSEACLGRKKHTASITRILDSSRVGRSDDGVSPLRLKCIENGLIKDHSQARRLPSMERKLRSGMR